MTEGRREDDWHHTANILSMLYNANRGKLSPRGPQRFHPCLLAEFRPRAELRITVRELAQLMGETLIEVQ